MGPPLSPTAIGYVLNSAAAASPVRVEMFLDLICPFSRKMFVTLTEGRVIERAGDRACFVLHQVPQPWHAQGSYVHEAALAVKEVAPDLYPNYIGAIYECFDKGKFTDRDTWEKSRTQINAELCDLAASGGVDRAATAAKLAMRASADGNNVGNEVTQAVKWICKHHRTRGVHVTPTVHVNGLEAGIVSSGWTPEQWLAFLEPNGADFWQGSKLQ